MTAPHIVDPARVLGNLLSQASPDLMRQLLQNMVNARQPHQPPSRRDTHAR